MKSNSAGATSYGRNTAVGLGTKEVRLHGRSTSGKLIFYYQISEPKPRDYDTPRDNAIGRHDCVAISDAHYVFLTRNCKRPLIFRARAR